jgi:hypothetical protein
MVIATSTSSATPIQLHVSTYLLSNQSESGDFWFQFMVLALDGTVTWSGPVELWSPTISPSVDHVTSSSSIHSSVIDQIGTVSTVRSAWTAADGVYFMDYPIDAENPPNSQVLPSNAVMFDACAPATSGGSFSFVAPLNANLLFTVDSAGLARIHNVADGGP